jgi:glycosyltransferase involved in cell wall biosynthesis
MPGSADYATDGGFPFQMRALSELFDETILVMPCAPVQCSAAGEVPLTGSGLSVVPLTMPTGSDVVRKLRFPMWTLRNAPALLRAVWRADAVHAPIPGDIGTIGIALAVLLRKPLFVRYCGNWMETHTAAERCWKALMERLTGRRHVMFATGGGPMPPSARNVAAKWIFATTLTESDLQTARRVRTSPQGARLIIVGRQEPEKGAATLIRALAIVRRRVPACAVDVVGDGPAIDGLRSLAASLRVDDAVRFHGRVDHDVVLQLLRDADIFCFPTATEGFPKVVIEALACGLPVVTSRVSVLPHLLRSGAGAIVDPMTPEALAAEIERCLTDQARYRAMSAAAVRVAAEYSLEKWRDVIGGALEEAWGPLQQRYA